MIMKYNFDEIVPRRGTGSVKWDGAEQEGVIPMWVADMDFRTAPAIIDAVESRAQHGIFGYTRVPDAYYQAVIGWFGRRHGFRIEKDWIIYVPGVVPALSAIIKAMTSPGDKVILQTPVYNCFFSSVRNNGCEVYSSPLVYRDVMYSIDFDDLERKAADPEATLMILCNPHNPGGRVWTREELTRIGEICLRHNVFVIADEIHCELTFPGHDYTPFASISGEFLMHSATCNPPTKAFNIAGLQISNIVTADAGIREKKDKTININEVCDVNPFGVEALVAAYDQGEDWLDALRIYLWENYQHVLRFFSEKLPRYPILPLEGTYLPWINIKASGLHSDELAGLLLHDAKVMLSPGTIYGPGGEDFLRLNIACPRPRLQDGLERLHSVLKRWE